MRTSTDRYDDYESADSRERRFDGEYRRRARGRSKFPGRNSYGTTDYEHTYLDRARPRRSATRSRDPL